MTIRKHKNWRRRFSPKVTKTRGPKVSAVINNIILPENAFEGPAAVPGTDEVWARSKPGTKAHLVRVNYRVFNEVLAGEKIMEYMNPVGTCPTAQKVPSTDWVGKEILYGTASEKLCSACAKLPASVLA